MSLLMPEETVLRESSTRRDLYFFALLRFDIVKKAYRISSNKRGASNKRHSFGCQH